MKRHFYTVKFVYQSKGLQTLFTREMDISLSDKALIFNRRLIKKAAHEAIWKDHSLLLRCNGHLTATPICYLGKFRNKHTPIKTFLEEHFGVLFLPYAIQCAKDKNFV